MLRIEGLRLQLDQPESLLIEITARIFRIPQAQIQAFHIIKKAVDARKKHHIHFSYVVDLTHPEENELLQFMSLPRGIKVKQVTPFQFSIKQGSCKALKHRPVIVGTGPCGLFSALVLAKAGLNPILVERGKMIEERIPDVFQFQSTGHLNEESNIQFGEGGAGAFSDGKLYTLVNDARSQFIFDHFVSFGAPPEIIFDAKPHIGTDRLRTVVRNMRNELLDLGAEIHFNTQVTAIRQSAGRIEAIQLNRDQWIPVSHLLLAIGHSARDTYAMLYEQSLRFTPKPFAIGVRIEHQKKWIQSAQYGQFWDHPALPSAKYKLVAHLPEGRSIFTFCMCPGGYVVPATSESGGLVTNGMSEYAQNGENSNSALLVNINPEDFSGPHPLSGIAFQRQWETAAFQLGGANYYAPVQRVSDFLEKKRTQEFGLVKPTYRPGVSSQILDQCLPDFVAESLRQGLVLLNRKLKGFAHPEAVLTGVETRSSSPVRIVRDAGFESSVKGIYPAGEGAGYAGGIISAALDGMKIAEKILEKL